MTGVQTCALPISASNAHLKIPKTRVTTSFMPQNMFFTFFITCINQQSLCKSMFLSHNDPPLPTPGQVDPSSAIIFRRGPLATLLIFVFKQCFVFAIRVPDSRLCSPLHHARPSLIRGGRAHPCQEPPRPTLAAALSASGFPTPTNSPGSNST